MNIIQKLTLRHLKKNKRRTLVTIIGTVISVAMITAVATLVISFLDLMQRQLIADQGEWHVQYHGVNEEQVKALMNDEATERLILSRNRGFSYIEGSESKNKPYIFIKEYNDSGLESFPITLKEGRFPDKPNEIVLSTEISAKAKVHYEIGDKVTFEIGERVFLDEEQPEAFISQQYSLRLKDGEINESIQNTESITYEVVGMIDRPTWEPTWSPGYTAIAYTDTSLITERHPVTASVVLNKVHRSIFNDAEKVALEIGLDPKSLRFNNDLLRFYGITDNDNLQSTMYSLAAIIMVVIIVGSVALIYNAFAISVSERARHLGMLSSVGATKRQKRNSVFFEGAIIGLISIPIGVFSGLVGLAVTFWFINRLFQDALNVTEELTVVVTSMSIVTAVGISILTIFVSTYLPARKASKISAIDAIRQTTDIKLTGKVVKTSKLVRKLFGIEAEIGLKNLKRNKRKYQITVFSLAVSIILFLVVSFFTYSLEKSIELTQEEINFDIRLSLGNEEIDERSVESIIQLEDVTSYSNVNETFLRAMIDETDLSDTLKNLVADEPDLLEQGRYPYFAEVYSLNDESLEKYAEEIGIDPEPLFNDNAFRAIIMNQAIYEDSRQGKIVESKTIHTSVGEQIDLFYEDFEDEKKDFISAVTIEALTDQLPLGITTSGGESVLKIFVSEAVFSSLLELENRIESYNAIYLNTENPLKTQEEIEEIVDGNVFIHNVFERRQQSEQMVLLISVFIYGFIVLITSISIANIFNTISTNILLRKREFAMLKSVGMTPKSFNKMIYYESVFYGLKSLLYGLPISIMIMYLLHISMMNTFEYRFELPWISILSAVIAVFVIVGSTMLYSISKVRKENIIETLKQENI